jgi:cell cycle checkpoint protein
MEPIFTAVSSNANHLYTLLRCIGFAPKASVQITPEGIRFSVEENRVMQGLAFLDKALFTTYSFTPPPPGPGNPDNDSDGNDDGSESSSLYPHFLISLSALLETLQIFGVSDNNTSTNSTFQTTSTRPQNATTASNAFTSPALLLGRSCTLRYSHIGSPLSITLSEAGVTTTCELTTYEPDDPTFASSAGDLDIPLQRNAIIMKIIMRSAWLHNAVTELDSTNPSVLTISASAKREPFFALSGSGGPFSESTVEFSIDKGGGSGGEGGSSLSHAGHHHKVLGGDGSTSRSQSKKAKLAPTVTETFIVNPPSSMGTRVKQNYRFSLLRKASRAMAVASKVSIRGDVQGVLSLQFMIELGGNNNSGGTSGGVPLPGGGFGSNVSFVDFRFVPLVDEDEEGAEEYDDGGEDEL